MMGYLEMQDCRVYCALIRQWLHIWTFVEQFPDSKCTFPTSLEYEKIPIELLKESNMGNASIIPPNTPAKCILVANGIQAHSSILPAVQL